MRDPKKVADKQIRRAQESTQDYVDGVNAVSVAPGQLAVKKQAKLKSNFNAAVDSGKWAEATGSVPLNEWQSKTAGKGASRYAAGVEDARPAIEDFQADFQPFVAKVKAELDNMPDATPAERKAKMNANFDKMAQYKRKRRRR